MLAIGTSNTVTKGDGNSRPVGSKRRDSRRPVRPRTCPKKPKKKVIATFRIPEQPVTNFNGDGVNTHKLKNVV